MKTFWCEDCWALYFGTPDCPEGHGALPERDMVETMLATVPIGDEPDDESDPPLTGLTFTDDYGNVLHNVHAPDTCHGPCPIHNPSDHHMRDWKLNYRFDRGMFERHCEHGVGHPDPDSVYVAMEFGNGDSGVHGCDGCCAS